MLAARHGIGDATFRTTGVLSVQTEPRTLSGDPPPGRSVRRSLARSLTHSLGRSLGRSVSVDQAGRGTPDTDNGSGGAAAAASAQIA